MSHYHFIAIGGAVMHNLALELHALGHEISGSDDEIFDPAASRLQARGLLPEALGWFPEKINAQLEGVILGMHAKADNPELQKAQELGVPIFSFPAFIHEHAKDKTRIVLAGSHGKTTCTAMLMHILKKEGLKFDYLVGSTIAGYERMVGLSNAPLMIIEGDEYLSSALDLRSKFLHYNPHYALITGIAWDHVNVFPTLQSYEDTFRAFCDQVKNSCWFYGGDATLTRLAKNRESFHAYSAPAFETLGSGTRVIIDNEHDYVLPFFGRHNIENASGVVEIAVQLGVSRAAAWSHLGDFPGTAKRLECLQSNGTEIIFRDFAHAPSKVAATVSAVRSQFEDRYFLSVFELHTYSSLQPEFMEGYKGLFESAEEAWVLFDPHVFELKRMPVPSKEEVAQRLGNVRVFDDPKQLAEALNVWRLASGARSRDAVTLWMSSGNFGGVKIV